MTSHQEEERYTTGQNCGTTYKNCIKNMLVVESGYLREKLS